MMKERDRFLDRMRTVAIVWVLMVHVLYWLSFMTKGTGAIVKSWLLLEMPLFFFITGAGISLSSEKPWGSFVYRSFRRMLIPYWCYAILCIILTSLISGGVEWGLLAHWFMPVDPQPVSVRFLTDALWYVPVYLLCVMLIPLLRRWKNRPWPVVALLVTLQLFFQRQNWSYPQNVAFYSLWIFAGLHYPQWKERYILQKSKRWEPLLTAGISIALLILLCRFSGLSVNMQRHKFPADGVFILYSIGAMSLFTCFVPAIVKGMDWLGRIPAMDWSMKKLSQYSLSVFLYQPYAFLVINELRRSWLSSLQYSVQLPVCFVLILPLAVVLAVVFGPLERLGKGKA